MMRLLISYFLKLHNCTHKVLLQLDVILALHTHNVHNYMATTAVKHGCVANCGVTIINRTPEGIHIHTYRCNHNV